MFVIQVPYCSIAQIFYTDQSFRWIKLDQDSFFITHKDKGVRVRQQKDRLIFDCNEKDFFNVWYEYLDICSDYMNINFEIRNAERELKHWSVRAQGVHLLRQDLFEVIITSMLLQAKSGWSGSYNVKRQVDFLCDTCGLKKKTSVRGAGTVKWHNFPTPEQIVRKRKILIDDGLGGCANDVISLCQDVIDGWLVLDELKSMKYQEAMEFLQEYSGINKWIAERICAFGLNILEAYPIDKVSSKVLQSEFDCKARDFDEWYLKGSSLKKHRALIALWAKYQANNPPKDERFM